MVDRRGREPKEGPRFRVLRGGADEDTDREGREGRDGREREPGRDAAGRDRDADERDAPGQAKASGRDAGPSGPMEPDAVDEQQRRDRRLVDAGPDPVIAPDDRAAERDAALSNADALRDEAAGLRAEGDRHENTADYHDRWMYDANAAAAQATDPAARSLAIRDENEHRAASVSSDADADHDDRLADAADAAADRQVAAAPAGDRSQPQPRYETHAPPEGKATPQYHAGTVKDGSPLRQAHDALSANATQGRKGSRRSPNAPAKKNERDR